MSSVNIVRANGLQPGQLPLGNKGVLDNPQLDNVWAGYYTGQVANPYYDYYFSGQDIKITMDGLAGDPNFSELGFSSFMFSVEQKAMALFGYNDFTYRTIAKGGRIVSGEFGLFTKSPDYFMTAVAAAAKARSTKSSAVQDNYYQPLTEDDANLQQYWGNNLDPANAGGKKPNLLSTHPPFSLNLQYGVRDISIGSSASQAAQSLAAYYTTLTDDQVLNLDLNDRLVPAVPDSPSMQFIIDDVQIVKFTQAYDTQGNAIVDVYTFVARDIIYP